MTTKGFAVCARVIMCVTYRGTQLPDQETNR